MSICTGSTQPKTATPAALAVSFDYMASVLPPQLAWLKPFLPYIRPIYIADMLAFCGTEPTLPSLTGVTIGAVLAGGEFGAAVVAAEAIAQIVEYYVWLAYCECASGSPTPATPPSAPADLPVINPFPGVGPAGGSPCRTLDVGTFTFVNTTPFTEYAQTPIGDLAYTSMRLHVHQVNDAPNAGAGLGYLTWDFVNADPTSGFTQHQAIGVANDFYMDVPVVANKSVFRVAFAKASDGSAVHCQCQITVEVFCGGQLPGVGVVPCCPPDPILTGQLQQILDLVTLIQRQAVPFGYIAGATHTGLSGAGALSISGLLGVKVAVTTLPSSYGVAGTSPPEHFDLGFVTFGTPDGFPSAFRLTRNPQVMMPARCSVYTDLDYDLSPGVVVTITELAREH